MRLLVKYVIMVTFWLPTILIFALLKLVRPVIFFRLGILTDNPRRIGHLAGHAELYLRRRTQEYNSARQFDILFTSNPPNLQLLRMIKRRVLVINGSIWLKILWFMRRFTRNSRVWIDIPFNFNEFYEFNNISPQLTFTADEEELGQKLLRSMGVPIGAPFVCFFARDSAYLDVMHPYRSRLEWSYHDHRDCDIENYLPAAEYVVSKGFFAVRMGQVVDKPLQHPDVEIIDYASNYRSDFGDIYLAAKCSFFVGCNSGIVMLPHIFGVPVAHTNLIPLRHFPLGSKDIFIPKGLKKLAEQKLISFPEILNSGMFEWHDAELYKLSDVKVIENSPKEILDLVKEMVTRLEGSWKTSLDEYNLRQRFRALFEFEHVSYGFVSHIGSDYIATNRYLLDEDES